MLLSKVFKAFSGFFLSEFFNNHTLFKRMMTTLPGCFSMSADNNMICWGATLINLPMAGINEKKLLQLSIRA